MSLDILNNQLISLFESTATRISVPTTFKGQNREILKLIRNDQTGIVMSILDFMVATANVDIMIDTTNPQLTKLLQEWKTNLNKDISKDIPTGLKALSTEYYRERWQRSSFIVLNVLWSKVDGWILPTKMWIADGSGITVDGDGSKLGNYQYKIESDTEKSLDSDSQQTIFIRKPFNSWYDKFPTPYMVKRGILYNAMFKRELVKKQAEMLMTIVPYMLLLKAGNDTIAKQNLMATQPELDAIATQIKTVKNDLTIGNHTGIGAFRYDINLEHFMPELGKMMNDNIVAPVDRNLLSALGLVELEGFSNSRKEAILNPKVLVEEVVDGVTDFVSLMSEVMAEMIKRNAVSHPKMTNNDIILTPSTIKAFVTDSMKQLIRSWYDRGLVSYDSALDTTTELNFNTELKRRAIEIVKDYETIMYPRLIMNQEGQGLKDSEDLTPEATKELAPEKKKSEKNIKGVEQYEEAPYRENKDLPENVKVLPQGAQSLWRRTFNALLKEGETEDTARKIAWFQVKRSYKKNKKGEWVKKAK